MNALAQLPHINFWQGLLVALLVVGVMEIVAIVSHKWVMHGFLWSLHKSHHEPRTGNFEMNDWFAVMGAVPSTILIVIGTSQNIPMLTAIGAGITAYGAIYFGFHDILVHRRVKHGWNPQSRYLKRIVQAHRLHHVVESKHGTVSYGFLYAPPIRTLKAQLEANGTGRIRSSAKMRADMDMTDTAERWRGSREPGTRLSVWPHKEKPGPGPSPGLQAWKKVCQVEHTSPPRRRK